MKPTLAILFPHASQSCQDRNPRLSLAKKPKNAPQGNVGSRNGKRGVMNKTESEFALYLEAQKRIGEILRYEFEGITLRWADMRYTPDFVVFVHREQWTTKNGRLCNPMELKLIEVKGGHIWDRDIVRFKGARAYWPEFAFEMHQKTKQGWNRKF